MKENASLCPSCREKAKRESDKQEEKKMKDTCRACGKDIGDCAKYYYGCSECGDNYLCFECREKWLLEDTVSCPTCRAKKMEQPELKKVNWEMIRDAGHKDPNLYIWFLEMYGHDEVEYGQIQQWFKEHAVAEWPQWFQQNILPLISPPQPKFKIMDKVYIMMDPAFDCIRIMATYKTRIIIQLAETKGVSLTTTNGTAIMVYDLGIENDRVYLDLEHNGKRQKVFIGEEK
jgi:hypothetical protein